MYGRRLLSENRNEEALAVFELNAQRHPSQWPVDVGLARGYSAVGRLKKALRHAEKAIERAPDASNKDNLRRIVADLKAGKPI